MLPKTIKASSLRVLLLSTTIFFFFILFWFLRITYWGSIHEEPFSDMADYLAISKRFMCCATIEHSHFWQGYLKPALPVFAAGVFSLIGEDNLEGWRYAQGSLLFLSLIWLAYEIYATKMRSSLLLALGLLLIVSISKSSVFWSYKFATEGFGEALLYLLSAMTLYIYRVGKAPFVSTLEGIVLMFALYNRPNIILIIPFIVLAITIKSISFEELKKLEKYKINALGFAVGALLVVTPLAIRNYKIYNALVLSPTQGPYSFLWELGAVPLKNEDGTVITKTAQELQADAPKQFANDYLASLYAKKFVQSWMRDNWNELYPKLIRNRFFASIEQRDIALSKVDRKVLFNNTLENILIDKTFLLFLSGVCGLIFFAAYYRNGFYVIAASAILPWLFALFFISDPRTVEPSLPLILFGNWALIVIILDQLILKRVANKSI